jgi:hypothetical protein
MHSLPFRRDEMQPQATNAHKHRQAGCRPLRMETKMTQCNLGFLTQSRLLSIQPDSICSEAEVGGSGSGCSC